MTARDKIHFTNDGPRIKIVSIIFFISLYSGLLNVYGQNEEVTFDLDNSKFNVTSLPYIKPLLIKGEAVKNNIQIDIIQLTVTQLFSRAKDKLKIKEYELIKLNEVTTATQKRISALLSVQAIVSQPEFLEKKDSAANILALANFKDLSKLASDGDLALSVELSKILNKLNDEIADNAKESVKLQAKILELKEKIGKAIIYQEMWSNAEGEKEFNFQLHSRLEMSEDYSFEFKLFTRNKSPFPVARLLNQLYEKANSKLESESFYPDTQIAEDVANILETIKNDLFSTVVVYDSAQNIFLKKEFLIEDNQQELIRLFKEYYTNKKNAVNEQRALIDNKRLMNSIIRNHPVYGALTNSQSQQVNQILNDLSNNDADSVRTLLTSYNYPDPTVNLVLVRYVDLFNMGARIDSATAKFTSDSVKIENEFAFIKDLYISKGNVTENSSSRGSGESDVDGIRISTVYGIGLVPLEDEFEYIEWFRFIGVNIRLNDFDNRLEGSKAYKNFLSRISVLIAISTTTTMEYKGLILENTRLGFKPVIGLNFEPIKHLNLGGGIISFIPEPVINSRRDVKIRPFISLSFDFNLFNYLIQKN